MSSPIDLGWIESPFLGWMEFDSPDAKKTELKLLERVATKITGGLKTTLAAKRQMKSAQQDLVSFMVSVLNTDFFPDGHGRLDSKGNRLRSSALGRIVIDRWPRFEHRLRVFLSAQSSGERNGRHSRQQFSSIVLFAPRLDGMTATGASGVALHEMAHMARWMVVRLVKKFGETEAAALLGDAPWRLLDLSGFKANRDQIKQHLPGLLKVLPIPETASVLASSLVEEAFAYVLGAIIDEAIALDEHQRSGARGSAVLPTSDFSPEALVRSYVLHRYNVSKKQLTSASATKIYEQMNDSVRDLGTAMRAHLEQ